MWRPPLAVASSHHPRGAQVQELHGGFPVPHPLLYADTGAGLAMRGVIQAGDTSGDTDCCSSCPEAFHVEYFFKIACQLLQSFILPNLK